MNKKLTFVLALLYQCFWVAQYAHGYCAVYRETDAINANGESTEASNFRTAVNIINRAPSSNHSANECELPTNDPDHKAGFSDLIWFGTEFFVTNDAEAVSTVTLAKSDLDLKPYRNVKIGNSSLDMLADDGGSFANNSYSKSSYFNEYVNIYPKIPLPQNDVVTIDGRLANLKCSGIANSDGALKGYVYLSDVIVLAAAGEIMNQGCWRNAGNAFLCDGALKDPNEDLRKYSDPHGEDYTKWCDSDSVGPETPEIPENSDSDHVSCSSFITKWRDGDGDGFGDPAKEISICEKWINTDSGEEVKSPVYASKFILFSVFQPDTKRFADNKLDCQDDSIEINPNATEICDNLDNNCNNNIDETFENAGTECSTGVGVCLATGTWQCSDDGVNLTCDAISGSSTTESCNGLDDDCDGVIDEDNVCEIIEETHETLCEDIDGTGTPVDNDGDGAANCLDSDCATATACLPIDPSEDCSLNEDGATNCYDTDCWTELDCAVIISIDQDGDSVTIQDGDCNDEPTDPTARLISPLSDELCDEIDNNCNNEIDEIDLCVTPNESDDESSQGGCGCYLGNQPQNSSQKFISEFLTILFCLAFVCLRHKTQKANG